MIFNMVEARGLCRIKCPTLCARLGLEVGGTNEWGVGHFIYGRLHTLFQEGLMSDVSLGGVIFFCLLRLCVYLRRFVP